MITALLAAALVTGPPSAVAPTERHPSVVRFRVRIDRQSDRVRAHVTAGATTPEAQLERLDAFVIAFRAKWRARTACRRTVDQQGRLREDEPWPNRGLR